MRSNGILDLIVIIFSVFLSIIFFSISLSEQAYKLVMEEFFLNPQNFIVLGVIFSGISFLLYLGFYNKHKGSYLTLKMNPHPISVKGELLEKYLYQFYQSSFPQADVKTEIEILDNQTIKIIAITKNMQKDETIQFLTEVEKKIPFLLKELFFYEKPFIFTLVSR